MFKYCIVGGGPAALVLADTLRARVSAADIVIVEAGGVSEQNEEFAQFVSKGRTDYKPIRSFRLGGHGHLWGGACPRLHPDDFRMYSRFGLFVDWPIDYSDLEPYYVRAEKLLSVGSRQVQISEEIADDPIAEGLSNNGYSGTLPYGNRRYFVDELLPELRGSGVVILTGCVVRRIDESDGVASVSYHDLQTGATQQLAAECVVMCCGGLSNARILQLSRSDRFPSGMGNHSGLLGCYHMDHPRVTAVIERNHSAQVGSLDQDGELPLTLVKAVDDKHPSIAFASISITRLNAVKLALEDIERTLSLFDGASDLLDSLKGSLRLSDQVSFDLETMDPPIKENRLELADSLDVLGDPMLATNINIDPQRADVDNLVLSLLNEVFEKAGYRVTKLRKSGWTGQHPSGSTRMATRPEEGVVDSNLRVFGTTSVYVLGSSVFPTVGYSNPTLTIVSMALRLSDHLSLGSSGKLVGKE